MIKKYILLNNVRVCVRGFFEKKVGKEFCCLFALSNDNNSSAELWYSCKSASFDMLRKTEQPCASSKGSENLLVRYYLFNWVCCAV